MDEQIVSFLDFTGTLDESVAKQYLDLAGNNLEYAVQLFMESGGNAAAAGGSSGGGNSSTNDEELAQRLQQEAYGNNEDNVREADANVHRHETLMDTFDGGFGGGYGAGYGAGFGGGQQGPSIFGNGRVGIFNQRYDEDENEYYTNRDSNMNQYDEDDEYDEYIDEDDEDDEEGIEDNGDEVNIVELDSDGEVIESEPRRIRRPTSRRRRARQNRINELNSTQRRLANLFRPPFDIMEKVDIDGAKKLGRQQQKWILVNIQDVTEFICQVLNRDFWSNKDIKKKVKENFIFLQYQHDSPNGEQYKNFYSVDKYPHILILDPLTGERVYKFIEGSVPDVEDFLEKIDEFLNKFSLLPNSNNPIVHHEKKFNPDELSEEQQIEYAMKQSMTASASDIGSSSVPELEPESSINENTATVTIDDEDDIDDKLSSFDKIVSKEYIIDESDNKPTTRLQIRFPNGKRIIQKFKLDDNIETIYSWLKFVQSDYPKFNLSNASNKSFKMIENLDKTLEESGLKNASILLESE